MRVVLFDSVGNLVRDNLLSGTVGIELKMSLSVSKVGRHYSECLTSRVIENTGIHRKIARVMLSLEDADWSVVRVGCLKRYIIENNIPKNSGIRGILSISQDNYWLGFFLG